jgi:putative ABC transport system permease protein
MRVLLRTPLFTIPVVLCIALVLAANSTVFGVVDALMFRAVPFEDPDRLVILNAVHSMPDMEPEVLTLSPKDFVAWREQAESFAGIASVYERNFNLADAGADTAGGGADSEPERLEGALVGIDLFNVLRVQPAKGRMFTEREESPGGEQVAILSHRLWQRRFGSDPDIVGQVVLIDGAGTRVVGVMPEGFRYPNDSEIWLPQIIDAASPTHYWHYIRPVARLAPGVTVEEAETELVQIADRLADEFPDTNRGWSADVQPMAERVVGDMAPRLLALWGGVVFLLLITCANVANLLLARGTARAKEMAVRIAMGSSRQRLMLMVFMEGLLLALWGGLLGLVLTQGAISLIHRAPLEIPALRDVALDYRVAGFTFLVILVTGLFFSLAPAFRLMRLDPQPLLKEGRRGATQMVSGFALQGSFVVAQVAVTLVLLTTAGLLIRSFQALESVDPGFEPANLLTFRASLPDSSYPGSSERVQFANQAIERLSGLPGVSSAALTTTLPIGDRALDFSASFTIRGRPPADEGSRFVAAVRRVTPAYFRTLGVDLVEGRVFDSGDRADTQGVVVVSQTMADQFWPGESPVGKQIKDGDYDSPEPWKTVVGVVKDVKDDGLQSAYEPVWYLPYSQHETRASRYVAVLLRTDVDPTTLVRPASRQIRGLDRLLPLYSLATMDQLMDESLAQSRLVATIFAILSGLGLVIAAIGLYAVMSYVVNQRLQEISIRMAMGADRKDVVRLVLRRGMILTGIGVGLGFVITTLVAKPLSSLLYGVEPMDFVTLAAVVVMIVLVGVLANVMPARRATRADLLMSLREG